MLRGQCESMSFRSATVESRPLGVPAPTPEAAPVSPQEVEPPGTRVLASSFKPDGSRYRPGERLEKQARKWAAASRPKQAPVVGWSRNDAKATLTRLMESLEL